MAWIVFPVFGHLGPEWLDARGPRLVAKRALEPFFHKAFLPALDAGLGFASSSHDLVRADPIGSEQDDLSPPDVLLRSVAIFNESFEPPSASFDCSLGAKNLPIWLAM